MTTVIYIVSNLGVSVRWLGLSPHWPGWQGADLRYEPERFGQVAGAAGAETW